ncbi:MAG: hypothetical protein PHS41_00350 [Victivallaceae bacterium]|nr:hypothetical protein [Victivallaceae bacterium]
MQKRKNLLAPLLIILIGTAWLLNQGNFIPGVDWVWTSVFFLAGASILLGTKPGRFAFVSGMFLMLGTILSIFRQTGKLSVSWEVPILVVLLGVLMLIAQFLSFPLKAARRNPSSPAGGDNDSSSAN